MKKSLSLFILLISSWVCQSAHAYEGLWSWCDRTSGYYQYFNSATVSVGKNAQVGDFIGGWFSSGNPTAWNCTQVSGYASASIPTVVTGYPPYTVYGSVTEDGQTYNIYQSAVKAGLGYIVRWRYTVQGQTSDWQALSVATGGTQIPTQYFNATGATNNATWNIGLDVQIRFVKTASTLTAGSVPLFDPIYAKIYQVYNGQTYTYPGTYMIAQFASGGLDISTTGGTCTTPDVSVTLPPVGRSEFTGIGHTTARTDFNLNFNECPGGMASISYLFTPTTDIIDNSNGTFKLSQTSTASGVALQLLDSNDTPLTFNTNYLLTDYDTTKDKANYVVPLRAGLYQTDANVSSGDVNGSVTFTLSYK